VLIKPKQEMETLEVVTLIIFIINAFSAIYYWKQDKKLSPIHSFMGWACAIGYLLLYCYK